MRGRFFAAGRFFGAAFGVLAAGFVVALAELLAGLADFLGGFLGALLDLLAGLVGLATELAGGGLFAARTARLKARAAVRVVIRTDRGMIASPLEFLQLPRQTPLL